MIEALLPGKSKREDDLKIKLTSSTKEEEKLSEQFAKNHQKSDSELNKDNKKELKKTSDLINEYAKKDDLKILDKIALNKLIDSYDLAEKSDTANKIILSEVSNKIQDIKDNNPVERVKRFGKSLNSFLEDAAFMFGEIFSIGSGLFGLMGEGFETYLEKHPKKKIEENDSVITRLGKFLFNKGRKAGIFLGNIFGGNFKDDLEDDLSWKDVIETPKNNKPSIDQITDELSLNSENIKEINSKDSLEYWDKVSEKSKEYMEKYVDDSEMLDLFKTLNELGPISDINDPWSLELNDWKKHGLVTIDKDGHLSFSQDVFDFIKKNKLLSSSIKTALTYKINKHNVELKFYNFIMSNISDKEKDRLMKEGWDAWLTNIRETYYNDEMMRGKVISSETALKDIANKELISYKDDNNDQHQVLVNKDGASRIQNRLNSKTASFYMNNDVGGTNGIQLIEPGIDVANTLAGNKKRANLSSFVNNSDNVEITDYSFGEDTTIDSEPVILEYDNDNNFNKLYYQEQQVESDNISIKEKASTTETVKTDYNYYQNISTDTLDNKDPINLTTVPKMSFNGKGTKYVDNHIDVNVNKIIYNDNSDFYTSTERSKGYDF